MTDRPKLSVIGIDESLTQDVVTRLERAAVAAKEMRAYSAFIVLVGPDKTYINHVYPGNGKLAELAGQIEYEKHILLRDAIANDER